MLGLLGYVYCAQDTIIIIIIIIQEDFFFFLVDYYFPGLFDLVFIRSFFFFFFLVCFLLRAISSRVNRFLLPVLYISCSWPIEFPAQTILYDPPPSLTKDAETLRNAQGGGYVIRVNSNRIDLFSLSCYLSRFEFFFFFLENV